MQISNCCGATVIENTDLCSACFEHTEVVEEEVFHGEQFAWLEVDYEPKSVKYNGKEIR